VIVYRAIYDGGVQRGDLEEPWRLIMHEFLA
jgi:hypothetical protein